MTTPGKQVARATAVVSALTLASRVLGLVRDSVTAAFFGAGFATDAFFVAFRIPNLLRRLVAEGSLGSAFLPIFADEQRKSQDCAREAIGAISSVSIITTLVITFLGIAFAEELTLLFAPGFAADPSKIALSTSLLRVMLPYIVFVSLLALASSVLNTCGHFAWPAAAQAILNVVIVITVVLFTSYFEIGIYSFAWGFVIGGVVCLLPQLVVLKRLGFPIRFQDPRRKPVVRAFLRLLFPSLMSSSVYQLMIFINTLLASMLVEGAVSWLYYADRVFQFPLGVFSLAIATAVFPMLSQAAAADNDQSFRENLTLAVDWISFITIPATVGLVLLAQPMIEVLFERGNFTAEHTTFTADALQAFSLGLWAISCQSVFVRAYLAKKNSLYPSVVSVATILLGLLLSLALMGPPASIAESWLGEFIATAQQTVQIASLGPSALALAGSISALLSVLFLWGSLSVINTSLPLRPTLMTLSKTILASLLMGGVLIVLRRLESPWVVVFGGIPVAAGIYLCITYLLRCPPALVSVSYAQRWFKL